MRTPCTINHALHYWPCIHSPRPVGYSWIFKEPSKLNLCQQWPYHYFPYFSTSPQTQSFHLQKDSRFPHPSMFSYSQLFHHGHKATQHGKATLPWQQRYKYRGGWRPKSRCSHMLDATGMPVMPQECQWAPAAQFCLARQCSRWEASEKLAGNEGEAALQSPTKSNSNK